ncbi:MAG: hypothetical protein F6J97_03700 [Leptolyngbya sp. SIO4C1]|nr:hypothetical protein [Leptolyngbya sp. SIO4C1]
MSVRLLFVCMLLFNGILVAAASADGVTQQERLQHFQEGGLITWVSALQLLAIAAVSARLSRLRYRMQPAATRWFNWRAAFVVWAAIALGFCFLAVDELTEIHESLDQSLHELFGISETGLTDRLDDLLVMLYAASGLGLLYVYRREIGRYRTALPFLISGFSLLFGSILIDTLTNRPDVLSAVLPPSQIATFSFNLAVLEELLKLLSEGCFLVGFWAALRTVSHKLS